MSQILPRVTETTHRFLGQIAELPKHPASARLLRIMLAVILAMILVGLLTDPSAPTLPDVLIP